jgi:hypothetical protein
MLACLETEHGARPKAIAGCLFGAERLMKPGLGDGETDREIELER